MGGRRKPLLSRWRQRFADYAIKWKRHTRTGVLERGSGSGHDGVEHFEQGATFVGSTAGDKLIENDSQRVDIGSQVDVGLASSLLRRHVIGRSNGRPCLRRGT